MVRRASALSLELPRLARVLAREPGRDTRIHVGRPVPTPGRILAPGGRILRGLDRRHRRLKLSGVPNSKLCSTQA